MLSVFVLREHVEKSPRALEHTGAKLCFVTDKHEMVIEIVLITCLIANTACAIAHLAKTVKIRLVN